jgi:hypothetical protein
MCAVMREWNEPPFGEAGAFVAAQSPFRLQSPNQSWSDFEAIDANGESVLAADVWTGDAAREEFAELEESLDELDGDDGARDVVRQHLREADAVVGMQVLMSRYDDSVAAANRASLRTSIPSVGTTDPSSGFESANSAPDPRGGALQRDPLLER